ncbi:dehydrogenase/reductase SDR family member 7-like isoform X1 [Tachypleus tridentatus]|uniref:dehydrogenase/reductase SDR family member 7-like isoform X1 n=1 Tax=Tachypleus tridentatus TaxID=6853 RepID=UPI003FD3F702
MDAEWMWLICLIILLFVVLWFKWFYFHADGDLTLMWAERYGRSPAELRGKVAWITGASSGIGEALAYELAKYGVRLALSGRNVDKLEAIKTECIVQGSLKDDDVLLVPFDITDFSKHSECFQKVVGHFKKLDILVNNAGRSQWATFDRIFTEVDYQIFGTNVFSHVSLTRVVLPHFLSNGGGHVMVNSSVSGKYGIPNSSSYTGTKHAIQGYFECLRTEFEAKGVFVTIVCPGLVFSKVIERSFTGIPGEVFNGKQKETDKRMRTSRCAQLMAVALANNLDEAWISLQPFLLICYLSQYMPTFFRRVIIPRFLTPEKFAILREGRN